MSRNTLQILFISSENIDGYFIPPCKFCGPAISGSTKLHLKSVYLATMSSGGVWGGKFQGVPNDCMSLASERMSKTLF